MYEKRYKVLINDEIIAKDMNIRTAIVLVKALFEEYYNDYTMTVSIKQEDNEVRADEIYDKTASN